MQRKAIRLSAILVTVWPLRRLRLRRTPGDEGREAGIRVARLGLRHARLVAHLGRLCVAHLARLIGLAVARHERLRIGRNVGLRLLARTESLIGGERLPVVAAILEFFGARLELLVVAAAAAFLALRLEIRILLAELLVRRRDQAEIMLSMLEVVFGRDRIAGGLAVTRKLEIFLRYVMRRAANFHIGAVRLVNPRQGILIAPVVVLLLVIAPAHTLVVMMLLTVSHGLLFNDS
jgi:hypothetical protein